MRRAVACAFAVALVCAVAAAPALAAPDDVANEIAGEVMSPFCPGVTLENCPSNAAVELRARITSWAEMGWSKERIMDRLVDEYGPTIRAIPPKSGSGLWAWLAPALALLLGGGLAALFARRWSGKTHDAPAPDGDLSAELKARVDSELRSLRGQT